MTGNNIWGTGRGEGGGERGVGGGEGAEGVLKTEGQKEKNPPRI